MSVKDLKDKLDQRQKDLDRAKSTATSDPSAKEDITDVGDMEIESDGETQEPQPDAPGMITVPPTTTDPRAQVQQTAGYVRPPPPAGTYRAQVPPLPPQQQQVFGRAPRPRPGPAQFQNRLLRPSLRPVGRGMLHQRPHPPRQRPPFPGRGPLPTEMNNFRGAPPPGIRTRPPFRVPPISHPPDPKQSHIIISSSPIIYNTSATPTPSAPVDEQGSPEKESNSKTPTSGGARDGQLSLDERLRDMMLNKKFGDSVLSEVDAEPYSPSANEPVGASNLSKEPDEGVPSPSSGSPEEPNMDYPILKVLYKSQSSPEQKTLSPTDDDDELSSNDLKNILDQVKSSEPAETDDLKKVPHDDTPTVPKAVKLPAASEIKITPTLTNLLDEIFPKISQSLINRKRKQDDGSEDATKMPRLTDTPPRPRMPPPPFHAGPPAPGARPPFERPRFPAPRVPRPPVRTPVSSVPQRMPFPNAPAAPGVSTPPARMSLPSPARMPPTSSLPARMPSRMPFPNPAVPARGPLPPARMPLPTRPEFPRPFGSYETPRLLQGDPTAENRFGRPGTAQDFMGGMRPPMVRTYAEPGMYARPPGYRPQHPRHA